MPLSKRKEVAAFVHRKILFRLRRLAIFFIIVLFLMIYEVQFSLTALVVAVAGLCLGWLIGFVSAHEMHEISWDEQALKVVSRMDRTGIIVLVIYILFALSRRWIFSHWLQGNILTACLLSISCGGIASRLWYVRKKVRRILKAAGKLHPGKPITD